MKHPVTECAYVGLDLSLTGTGVCVKQGDRISLHTIKTNTSTSDNDLLRLEYIRDAVMELIPPSAAMICVEDWFIPRRSVQMNAAMKLIQLGTVVRLALFHSGFPFYTIVTSQLKKFVLGKGNGKKQMVLREVYKKWDVNAKDDNQADACVLAFTAEAIHQNGDMFKYQQEVVDTVIEGRPSYNVL